MDMWIPIVTAIAGAFFGATARLSLEIILPGYIDRRREARLQVGRAKLPLLQSGISLHQRLYHVLRVGQRQAWLAEDGYYLLSTVYITCRFIFWLEAVENVAFMLGLKPSRGGQKLGAQIRQMSRGLNNLMYFQDLIEMDELPEGLSLNKYVCLAISELMTRGGNENLPECLGFLAFVELWDTDLKARNWFDQVAALFKGLTADKENLRWDRLCVILHQLGKLIRFLDPKSRLSSPVSFDTKLVLNPEVLAHLKS